MREPPCLATPFDEDDPPDHAWGDPVTTVAVTVPPWPPVTSYRRTRTCQFCGCTETMTEAELTYAPAAGREE